jgi:hypothetical protein
VKAEVDELKKIAADQAREYKEQIENLKNERLFREEEMRIKYMEQNHKLGEIEEKISKAAENNYLMTKDYIDLKHLSECEERKYQEECHALKLENDEYRRNTIATIERTKQEAKNIQAEMSKVSSDIVQQLKFEGQKKGESLMIIKEQYQKIQQIYANRIQALQDTLQRKTKKCDELKTRNTLEMEGYQRDIDTIRRKLGLYTDILEGKISEEEGQEEPEEESREEGQAEEQKVEV